MSESDPAYFGYWSKEEVLNFLKDLLESERMASGRLRQSDARPTFMLQTWSLSLELAQGAICVLLKKEIARRGGARTARQKDSGNVPMPKRSLQAHGRIRTRQSDQAGRHD